MSYGSHEGGDDINGSTKGGFDLEAMVNMKQLGTSTMEKGEHDDVDIVLLELGLPLSVVTQSKEVFQAESTRLKNALGRMPNDPTDPFVIDALTQLRALKKQAVAKEDFIEARRLKTIIVRATRLSKRITQLQNMKDAHETSKQLTVAADTHLNDVEAIKSMGRRQRAQEEMRTHRDKEISLLKEDLDELLPQKRLKSFAVVKEKKSIDEELGEQPAEIQIDYNETAAASQRRHLDEILKDWVWSSFHGVQHPPELTPIQKHEHDLLAGTFGHYVFQCLLSGHPTLRKLAIQAVDHHMPGMVLQTGATHMFRSSVSLCHLILGLNFCWEHDPSSQFSLEIGSYRAVVHLISTLYTVPVKKSDHVPGDTKKAAPKLEQKTLDEELEEKQNANSGSGVEYIDDRENFDIFKDVPKLTMTIGAIQIIPRLIDHLKHDAYNTLDMEESEMGTLTLDALHYMADHPSIGLDLIARMIIPSVDNIASSSWICSQLIGLKSIVGHYGYRDHSCLIREVVLPSMAMCLCHHDTFVRRLAVPTMVVIYGIENNQQGTSYVLRSKGVEDNTLKRLEAAYQNAYVIPHATAQRRSPNDDAPKKHVGPFFSKRYRTYHNPSYLAQGRHWHDISKGNEDEEEEGAGEEDLLEESQIRENRWGKVAHVIQKVEGKKTKERLALNSFSHKHKKTTHGDVLSGATDAERKAAQARAAAVKAARAKKARTSHRAMAAAAVHQAAGSFRSRLGGKRAGGAAGEGSLNNPLGGATQMGGLLKFSSILKARQAVGEKDKTTDEAAEDEDDEGRRRGDVESRESTTDPKSRESTSRASRASTAGSEMSDGDVRWRGAMDAEIPGSAIDRAEKRADKKALLKKFNKGFHNDDIPDVDETEKEASKNGTTAEGGIDYQAKDEYDVEFPRGPLGLALGTGQDVGVVIRSVKPGGFAERTEKVKVGDKLIAIKDEVVLSIAVKDANQKIREGGRPLLLRFKKV